MDTELLKTFLEVENTRHFGRAADNLCITPAAVSARIKQLESIIGLPLLTRDRKHISLTPAGEKLKPRAEEVLQALGRAIEATGTRPRRAQQLSIGSTPNIWEHRLAERLFNLPVPALDMTLRAECHDSGYLIAQLQSHQLDAAFLFDPITLEGLSCQPVAEVSLQLFSSLDNADSTCVGEDSYVLVDWSVAFGIEHARRHGDGLKPALVTSTGKVALAYLARHAGSAYFPVGESDQLLARGGLVPVPGTTPISLTLHILYGQGTRKQSQLNMLVEALR